MIPTISPTVSNRAISQTTTYKFTNKKQTITTAFCERWVKVSHGRQCHLVPKSHFQSLQKFQCSLPLMRFPQRSLCRNSFIVGAKGEGTPNIMESCNLSFACSNGSPVKHETTICELSLTTGTGCFWDKDWLQASRSKWSRLLSFMRTLLLDLQPTVKELRMEVLVLSGFQLWSKKHGLCPHNHRNENYIPKKQAGSQVTMYP